MSVSTPTLPRDPDTRFATHRLVPVSEPDYQMHVTELHGPIPRWLNLHDRIARASQHERDKLTKEAILERTGGRWDWQEIRSAASIVSIKNPAAEVVTLYGEPIIESLVCHATWGLEDFKQVLEDSQSFLDGDPCWKEVEA